MEKSYKQRHEDFVSGLSGGPVPEIYYVTLIGTTAYVVWACVQTRTKYFQTASLFSRIFDFLLNWIGPLLSMTLYSSMPILLNLMVLGPGLLVWLSSPLDKSLIESKAGSSTSTKNTTNAGGKDPVEEEYLPKKAHLTVYRGSMMVITCIAILAVDFPLFPRRFAKVETWGTSLMDLGVGSFVFSMGLVSARTTLLDSFKSKKTPLFKSLRIAFAQSASVLGLGIIRLICVKFFDYQEHVTEYGVHWNFFMTLGFLPIFVSLLLFIPKKIPLALISLLIAGLYELALDNTDLGAFVLTAPRVDVISSNKEGIFSFFGYLAIFLAGKSTGYYALPASVTKKSFWVPQSRTQIVESSTSTTRSKTNTSGGSGSKDTRWRTVLMLVASSVVHNILLQVSLLWLTPSRRLANLPYVLWMVSFNTAFVAILLAIETTLFPRSVRYEDKVPESLEAVNSNGLFIFLFANISTGVINMNIQTLDASRATTMLVLALYCLVLFTVSVILYRRSIRLKI